ncbi:hypothetical protein FCL40_14450 [Ferrimonas sediminicola]|uniref:Outer membrane protein beta-barrel domain-containing protein n=1 Tax=Ferrimonas sediminicola TaxID=2569538 RepID=A0A4U1BAV7_9GAMM|nr:hypothetical protein [Ferrimonas sediminicola]TKB47939.1 hypothetical protein FCL40_14450 [Ferrimonas sediminicola]
MIRATPLLLALIPTPSWALCGDLCQWLGNWFDDYLTPVDYNYAHASLAKINAADDTGMQLSAGALAQLNQHWLLDISAEMNWQEEGMQYQHAGLNRFQGRLDYRVAGTERWDLLVGLGTSVASWSQGPVTEYSISPVVAFQIRGKLTSQLDLEIRHQVSKEFDRQWNHSSVGLVFYPTPQIALNLRAEHNQVSNSLLLETRFYF